MGNDADNEKILMAWMYGQSGSIYAT